MFTALLLAVPSKLKLFLFLSPAGANKKSYLTLGRRRWKLVSALESHMKDHNFTSDPLDVLSELADSLRQSCL